MSSFAQLPVAERVAFVQETAARINLLPVIVEKDFWVCWALRQIFQSSPVGANIVFKGGTSLSTVFNAIQRFSEDIDLSVAPALLGWQESELDNASSPSQRRKRVEKLETACAAKVKGDFLRGLENSAETVLGKKPNATWMRYQLDPETKSPVLYFDYPSVLPLGAGYIQPFVKIEFGSLTDQRPTGVHTIKPMLAREISADFEDFQAEVVALEVERTFWEKATILHAEYHRPAGQPIRSRLARHYADVASLWRHPARSLALARMDLLERVVKHKSRFFSSSWVNYESAKPGSLKLRPPPAREAGLAKDYERMETMFLTTPPSFNEVLSILGQAEREINKL